MRNKKYGVWKTRYAENSRNIFETPVRTVSPCVPFSWYGWGKFTIKAVGANVGRFVKR